MTSKVMYPSEQEGCGFVSSEIQSHSCGLKVPLPLFYGKITTSTVKNVAPPQWSHERRLEIYILILNCH